MRVWAQFVRPQQLEGMTKQGMPLHLQRNATAARRKGHVAAPSPGSATGRPKSWFRYPRDVMWTQPPEAESASAKVSLSRRQRSHSW